MQKSKLTHRDMWLPALAKQFWSLTVYDRRTWAFVNNPLDRAGLGSFNMDQMKLNADGSVDLYVGPKAPAGLESNWIPTMGRSHTSGSDFMLYSDLAARQCR